MVLLGVEYEINDLPPSLFIGGDLCLFARQSDDIGPSPILCQGVKAAHDSSTIRMSLNFPIPVHVAEGNTLSCAIGLSRRSPRSLNDTQAQLVNGRCSLRFKRLSDHSGPVGKILRIPYLDTVRKGQNLISGGYYFAGTPTNELKIWGYSSFYLPAGYPYSHDVDTCLEAKSTTLLRRECRTQHYHFDLASRTSNAFSTTVVSFANPIVVSRGGVRGLCTPSATLSADCVIYVFAEVGSMPQNHLWSVYLGESHLNDNFKNNIYCDEELTALDGHDPDNHFTLAGMLFQARLAARLGYFGFTPPIQTSQLVTRWQSLALADKKAICQQLFEYQP